MNIYVRLRTILCREVFHILELMTIQHPNIGKEQAGLTPCGDHQVQWNLTSNYEVIECSKKGSTICTISQESALDPENLCSR